MSRRTHARPSTLPALTRAVHINDALPDEMLLHVFAFVVGADARDSWTWLSLARASMVCWRWRVLVTTGDRALHADYAKRFLAWREPFVSTPERPSMPPCVASAGCDDQTFAIAVSSAASCFVWAMPTTVHIRSLSWSTSGRATAVDTSVRMGAYFLHEHLSAPSTTLIDTGPIFGDDAACCVYDGGGNSDSANAAPFEWPGKMPLVVKLLPATASSREAKLAARHDEPVDVSVTLFVRIRVPT